MRRSGSRGSRYIRQISFAFASYEPTVFAGWRRTSWRGEGAKRESFRDSKASNTRPDKRQPRHVKLASDRINRAGVANFFSLV